MDKPITFKPIGVVHNGIDEAHHTTIWEEIESEIVIDPHWQPALEGLAEFSHIWIVFHIDRLPAPESMHVKPYLTRGDAIPDARVGEWVKKYWGIA